MVKHMTPATRQMGQTGVYLSCILPTGGGQYLPCRAHRALRTGWSGEAWGDGLCRNERARWPQVSEGGRAGRELTPLLRVKQGPHGKKCCLSGGPFLLERRGRAFCGLAIRSPPDFIRYQGSTEPRTLIPVLIPSDPVGLATQASGSGFMLVCALPHPLTFRQSGCFSIMTYALHLCPVIPASLPGTLS